VIASIGGRHDTVAPVPAPSAKRQPAPARTGGARRAAPAPAAASPIDLPRTKVPRELWKPPSARRVRGLRERLRAIYGIPTMAPHGDPLAELILTVLSQSTNDRNRDVAFLRLRERLPSWAAVRDAPVEEIEQAIQPGGLHVQKSRRIKQILEALPEDLDLSWMSTAPVPDAREYLTALPGVGRKTAACVLLFSYGRRDVPVDTHVSRVSTRLGLLRPGAALDPEQHEAMLALTPRGAELELHVNLLRHGRRTCFARAPACPECGLRRVCPGRMA
jgi:endonuclease-3